ncbi:hypothetical protein OAG48_00010 [bacterium]|nr:hypothetical protein [bacterium]
MNQGKFRVSERSGIRGLRRLREDQITGVCELRPITQIELVSEGRSAMPLIRMAANLHTPRSDASRGYAVFPMGVVRCEAEDLIVNRQLCFDHGRVENMLRPASIPTKNDHRTVETAHFPERREKKTDGEACASPSDEPRS